jgi:hypothetical protein
MERRIAAIESDVAQIKVAISKLANEIQHLRLERKRDQLDTLWWIVTLVLFPAYILVTLWSWL